MAQHQKTTIDGNITVIKILAGSLAAAILLMCLLLSQSALADQSDKPFQATVGDLPEEKLIKSLLTDIPDTIDDTEVNDDSWKAVRMRVTAYCPCSHCCGEYSDGITANNHRIQDGDRFVAADNIYAFGTEMMIPGYNGGLSVEVKDRGGAIQNDKLDVFFNTHEEALAWGVQHLYVLVKVQ